METVSSVGRGYYNYYHLSNHYETKDGKASEAWYYKDLSTEEINSNNSGILNKDYQGADICRKVAEKFEGIAAANRSRYSNADEMKDAVWAKYSQTGAYKHLSNDERAALARTEISMTLFGTVGFGEPYKVAAIDGDFTKNTLGSSEAENRAFNIKMLGKQIANVFNNNGVDISLFGNNAFKFSVNGMDDTLSVMLIGGSDTSVDNSLLEAMTKALNTKDNAKQLFYNILYDSNKRGLIASDSLAKFRLFSEFRHISGLDIREFEQTKDGFVNEDGQFARDVYKEALKHSNQVPAEFKGAAYEHFEELEKDAMRYDISNVPDLTLSIEYQSGCVRFQGDRGGFDMNA